MKTYIIIITLSVWSPQLLAGEKKDQLFHKYAMGYYGSVIIDWDSAQAGKEEFQIGKIRDCAFLTLRYWMLVESKELDRMPKLEKAIKILCLKIKGTEYEKVFRSPYTHKLPKGAEIKVFYPDLVKEMGGMEKSLKAFSSFLDDISKD